MTIIVMLAIIIIQQARVLARHSRARIKRQGIEKTENNNTMKGEKKTNKKDVVTCKHCSKLRKLNFILHVSTGAPANIDRIVKIGCVHCLGQFEAKSTLLFLWKIRRFVI